MNIEETQTAPSVVRLLVGVALAMNIALFALLCFIEISGSTGPGQTDTIPWLVLALIETPITGFLLWMFFARLYISSNASRIVLRFYPFHFKPRVINWCDVAEWRIRKLDPMSEFGGWGIRGWPGSKKVGYVWNARQALELTLTSGKIVVIGIQHPV